MSTEYRIVVDGSKEKIEASVNALMSKGWKPTGGIAMVADPHSFDVRYFQAMIYETPIDFGPR